MNKILLIIQREYLSRVKKKSFIVMTFLTPLLIAAFYGLIIYFSVKGAHDSLDKIAVVNDNKELREALTSTQNLNFTYVKEDFNTLKKNFVKEGYDYVLHIPDFDIEQPKNIQLIGEKQAGMAIEGRVARAMEEAIRDYKLKKFGITQADLNSLKTKVNIDVKKLGDDGGEKDSNAGAASILAMIAGIAMFMFIMLYGVQVMRGVIEEKTNRIIEVIISSVRPFQLMMGKILGIAAVGLTQFLLWIVLTVAISGLTASFFINKVDKEDVKAKTEVLNGAAGSNISNVSGSTAANSSEIANIQKSLESLPLAKITVFFLFYFLGGYLFYSAIYAAIGSAVDSETETQQFMMPVMMPLLLGYALSLSVVANDPYGDMAFWLSVIPFTSPIAMMVRLPFGVPDWQIALSMGMLILGFIGTVWIAARIYRVGILMYGKKASFKEMMKWMRYKS